MPRTRISKQLELSTSNNSVIITDGSNEATYKVLNTGYFNIGGDIKVFGMSFADVVAGVAPVITATPPAAPTASDDATLIRQYDDLVRVWYRTAGVWAHAFDIKDAYTRFVSNTATVYNYTIPPIAPSSDPFPGAKATNSVIQEEYANVFVWWRFTGLTWVIAQIHSKEIEVHLGTIGAEFTPPLFGGSPQGDSYIVPKSHSGKFIREIRMDQRVFNVLGTNYWLYKNGVAVPVLVLGPGVAPLVAVGLSIPLVTGDQYLGYSFDTVAGVSFGASCTITIY